MNYTENTNSYIAIPNGDEVECFALDTAAEIEVAQQAMIHAGVARLPTYAGHPDCPDSYQDGGELFAEEIFDGSELAEQIAEERRLI